MKELRRADEILKGGAGFLRGRARQATPDLVRFIHLHKDVFGVEPVCRVLAAHGLQIAPSTYYAARSRPASARAVRDEQLKAEIIRAWTANYQVYGAQKMWRELNRQHITTAQCTVERLMHELGLRGAVAAVRSAPPHLAKTGSGPLTCYAGTSPPRHRTGGWSRTSHMWRPGPAWSTSRSSSASTHAPSSAGRRPRTSGPSSCSTRWTWRCGGGTAPAHPPGRA